MDDVWFIQYDAKFHTANVKINLLKGTFGERIILHGGPVSWLGFNTAGLLCGENIGRVNADIKVYMKLGSRQLCI